MDYLQIIAEMRQELAQHNEAIAALERLARGGGKRRGRPPKWMSRDTADVALAIQPTMDHRTRKTFSVATRQKMARAQRARWAARRANG